MLAQKKTLYKILIGFADAICEGRLREFKLPGQLSSLTRKARAATQDLSDDKSRIDALLQLFYQDWGFHCDPERYFESEKLFLPYVLEKRSGMPVTLGSLLLYFADRLQLPMYPVNFPLQLMLRVELEDAVLFINPWDGKYISQERLHTLLEGHFGFGTPLKAEYLERAELDNLSERLQQLIKDSLIRDEFAEAAYRYTQDLIQQRFEPNPLDFRDRGLALAQLGAYPSAIEDFKHFIEISPQDPSAQLLKSQLSELSSEVASLQINH